MDITLIRNLNGEYGSHVCIHCGSSAAKDALFRSGDATLVEKYCDSYLQTERFTALMTFYESVEN